MGITIYINFEGSKSPKSVIDKIKYEINSLNLDDFKWDNDKLTLPSGGINCISCKQNYVKNNKFIDCESIEVSYYCYINNPPSKFIKKIYEIVKKYYNYTNVKDNIVYH
jgi:hypothetical protein